MDEDGSSFINTTTFDNETLIINITTFHNETLTCAAQNLNEEITCNMWVNLQVCLALNLTIVLFSKKNDTHGLLIVRL